MTDGSTGIQVAPTEDEMRQVQTILERAISAVVNMSQLAADVDMLRQTVTSLQSDTERLRQQNAGLDEALYQSRTARNELTSRLNEAEGRVKTLETDNSYLKQECSSYGSQLDLANEKLHFAEHSRDDAQLLVMELEEELKTTNAKLAKVKELFAPEPEPVKPTPIEPVSPVSQEPQWPAVDPTPAPIEPPVSRTTTRHYLDAWTAGALWDGESNRYYTES